MALKIVIVGAGIAGLSTGLALRRAGHIVTIYERSSLNNEIGAAIHVPPNASRPLLRWGLDPVAAKFVTNREISMQSPSTLQQFMAVPMGDRVAQKYGAPFFFTHRVDLHQALKALATEQDAPGTPVTIHLKSEVSQYDTEAPSITLSTGEVVRADLVIAADGIHSTAVETVLGHPNPPQAQELYNCCYRFLISASAVKEDPETSFFLEGNDGRMRLFLDNEARSRLICYPCRNNEVLNFVSIFHSEEMKGSKKEDWHASVNKTQMLALYENIHPGLLKVLEKATDVKYWALLFRAPIPTWRKGKLVLSGDAAHPMLPHQGQGGAQSLEDGVALGIVLCGAGPDDVLERMAIYEQIRRNRASAMQTLSNAGQDQVHLVHQEAAKYMGSVEAVPKSPQDFNDYNFGHDVVEEAQRHMKVLNPAFELPKDFFQK